MPNYVTNIIEFEGKLADVQKMLTELRMKDEVYGSIDFNKLVPEPATMNIDSGSNQDDAVSIYLSAINPETEDIGLPKKTPSEFKQILDTISPHFYNCKETINCTMSLDEANEISEKYFNNFGQSPLSTQTEDKGDILQYGSIIVNNIIKYGCKDWYEWRNRHWGTKWNAIDCVCQGIDSMEICFQTAWAAPHPVIEAMACKYPNIIMHHKWADEDWGSNTGYADYNEDKFNEPPPEPHYLEYGDESLHFAADILGIDIDNYYFSDGDAIYLEDFPISITEDTKKHMRETEAEFPEFVHLNEDVATDIRSLTKNQKIELIDSITNAGLSVSDFLCGEW